MGQTLYVPAYSHIYSGDREKPFLLAVTLSIRNTDPARTITVTRVDYYDTKGARIKTYIDDPILLKPMEATRYVVAENDTAGGSGASFMVAWASEKTRQSAHRRIDHDRDPVPAGDFLYFPRAGASSSEAIIPGG